MELINTFASKKALWFFIVFAFAGWQYSYAKQPKLRDYKSLRETKVIHRIDETPILVNIIKKELPLLIFDNPYIATKIQNVISKNKYLENINDTVYIALRPDSTIIISRCTNGIWLASGNSYEERSKHSYNLYIGHIRCNGHVVPIAIARDLPISWVKQDSTEMATCTIRLGGDAINKWKIISVKSMLRGREPIDSLTRNEMIHSWFGK